MSDTVRPYERLKSDPGFARNVINTSLGDGLVALAGLAGGVLAARLLTPAARGEYALLVLIVTITAAFSMLGTDVSMVYFGGQWHRDDVAAAALSLSAVMALTTGVAFAVVVGLGLRVFDLPHGLLLLGAASLPFALLGNAALSLLQSQYEITRFLVARALQP